MVLYSAGNWIQYWKHRRASEPRRHDVEEVCRAEERRGLPPQTLPPRYLETLPMGERARLAVDIIRDKVQPTLGCWIWEDVRRCLKAKPPSQKKLRRAWQLTHGAIPKSTKKLRYTVRQTCGNRRCVNPDHLRLDPEPEGKQQGKPPALVFGDGLVKVEARKDLLYNGRRYKQGTQFYAYQIIAEAAVKSGAVALLEGVPPDSHGGGFDGRCPLWGST
jgi:hypothetical protein